MAGDQEKANGEGDQGGGADDVTWVRIHPEDRLWLDEEIARLGRERYRRTRSLQRPSIKGRCATWFARSRTHANESPSSSPRSTSSARRTIGSRNGSRAAVAHHTTGDPTGMHTTDTSRAPRPPSIPTPTPGPPVA